MTNRDRLLAVLEHRAPDRVPWIPRLQLWYQARILNGDLPAQWQACSLREIERSLGVGTPARNGRIFSVRQDGFEVKSYSAGGKSVCEYHTPVGVVRSVGRSSEHLEQHGLPARDEEHLLKGPEDMRVWEYVVEHTHWVADYDSYNVYDQETGPDGLPMVAIGDVPFHEFAQKLAGYEHAYYLLADHPREV